MDNMTYLESLQQSAEKLDECIDILCSLPASTYISAAIVDAVSAATNTSMAISEGQLQRAVIAREHMQDSKREDV